ncbi:(2Fe-2S) ferredoxin [Fictibacillus solisalsi]|uniref:(2Fe-2S) ferredoxin n=1 Tax=Fictibacillus solisalsi TaxID=459525 RepID=A0A1G9VJE3_9BACL|nr:(2Fe-2S) ferredoxin domain-containing protein [Fictibacillus solisalsi]SDM72398.1 (2Fe-2S) ferredoxin [Fictibacillus solisalsi]
MELSGVNKHVLLCNGASCKRKGAEETTKAIRSEIKDQGLSDDIHTTLTLCNGRCQDGPTVVVYPDGDWYKHMTPKLGYKLIQTISQNQKLQECIAYSFNGKKFVSSTEQKKEND